MRDAEFNQSLRVLAVPVQMKSIIALLVAFLACASAWMLAARPPAQALQCPAPVQTPKFSMALEDAELDNPAIADDDKILPARKCGFCMG